MMRLIGKLTSILAMALASLAFANAAMAQSWQPGPMGWHYTPAPHLVEPRDHVVVRDTSVAADIYVRQVVSYPGHEAPGTLVVDTRVHFLYYVLGDGRALRYGIGVARNGFEWHGSHRITRKAEWPSWTPPAAMRQREPHLPAHMPGGIDNPLGARALYIGNTLYRIHGTNQPWTIGHDVSSGCIRMTNDDVIDLYGRVTINSRVIVLS
ncbi:hypothetical protein GCM10007989_28900 [Devosia pacifica]|uniref:L,D-TPase catalytic domain-containing protein n=1 Tax=Devosia pacifica TaxID=1335967 RepID=A0A918SBZ2_9HYPH|nr:L,D-transpeptidase [Devosia pacifica]GHA31175.1 hypothetical protein GCM10007989_28900 [Devosia pacifica]